MISRKVSFCPKSHIKNNRASGESRVRDKLLKTYTNFNNKKQKSVLKGTSCPVRELTMPEGY